ncbi:para-nitrobenzyl esterase [Sphaerotilus natans]|nr:para-nitrobenzyl esterase [Sphaerotilus natans]
MPTPFKPPTMRTHTSPSARSGPKTTTAALALSAALLTGGWLPASAQAADPLVRTSSGPVQGLVDDGVLTFRGIPYATAPRFMPPIEPAAWSTPLAATQYGPICLQSGQNPFPGQAPKLPQSDDCQNLNVWAPAGKTAKKRAVMVWLHGGGFSAGSSMEAISYEGKNLSKTGDVVVVSVNHRLNALGHLDLSAYGDAYKYSANLGVMDLVASLQWVRRNIGQFGGDPANVTVFGESGGGAKVLTLMATPAARGLFQKAIVQSGAVEQMGMNLTAPATGRRVAELTLQQLDIAPGDVARLQAVPYPQLVEATRKALKQTAEERKLPAVLGSGYGLDWTPTMDGDYIPVQPAGQTFAAQSQSIPLLIGTNLNEWTTIGNLLNRDQIRADNKNTWSAEQVAAKLKERFGDQADAVTQAFLRAYPDKKPADALFVDTFLRVPALKTAGLKADQHGAPVYTYVFSWETPALGGVGMAYHTAEIPFVFNNIAITGALTGNGPEAHTLAQRMSGAWVRFAKTGNPNGPGLPTWTPYTRASGATMVFDNTVQVRHHHDRELLKLLAPEPAH